MRILLATVVLVGCGFEHGSPGEQPDAGSGSSMPTDDSGTAVARVCKFPDPALRLCLEFDDHVFNPVVHDASAAQMDAIASAINESPRGTSPAAQVDLSSELRVPETPNLDIAGALSIEMWVQPGAGQNAYLMRNDGQYAMGTDSSGRVSCQINNGAVATSGTTIKTTAWTHVACTYDQSQIKVWINGKVQGCRLVGNVAVSTAGTNGTLLVPNWVGAVDDIRINARTLTRAEMCTRAGSPAGCNDACPPVGPEGPGPGGFGD